MSDERFPSHEQRPHIHRQYVENLEDRKEYFRKVQENLRASGVEINAGILAKIRSHWTKFAENRPSPHGAALKIKNSLS